jgi:hypothetical protein
MRFKDTIRLIKEALKTPEMYSDEEIQYMKKALDVAVLGLARKKFQKKKKGFGYNDETN